MHRAHYVIKYISHLNLFNATGDDNSGCGGVGGWGGGAVGNFLYMA